MMTTELKPCPFCGGTDLEDLTAYVYCSECRCCGPGENDGTDGVELWNAAPRRDDIPVAVAVEQETLHDKYVMAALTGLKAGDYGSFADMVHDARGIADAAMKARGT
jgi:hypothetical protein